MGRKIESIVTQKAGCKRSGLLVLVNRPQEVWGSIFKHEGHWSQAGLEQP